MKTLSERISRLEDRVRELTPRHSLAGAQGNVDIDITETHSQPRDIVSRPYEFLEGVLPNQIFWDDLDRCNVPSDRVYTALETVERFDHRFDFFLVHLHRAFHTINSDFLVYGVRLGTAMNTVAEWCLHRLSLTDEASYRDGFACRASVARLDRADSVERELISRRMYDLEIRAKVHVTYSIEPIAE